MLDFSDAPYQFFPAKPKRSVQWLLKQANRHVFLAGPNHCIPQVEVSGGEHLRDLAASGARILMVVNHPTHSDPQVITEVQRRLGVKSCFMAAYDVFLRSRLQAWFMQGNGAFSIDREGSDKQSMKEAIGIQKEGRFALTIFPEGNVYLNNDRVTPFMDGAAYVAMRAQKELDGDMPVYVVPVSLKMTYLEDVRDKVRAIVHEVAEMSGLNPGKKEEFIDEMRRTGRSVMMERLTECRHLPEVEELTEENFQQELEQCAERIIVRLEEKMELEAKTDCSLTDRIRRVRAGIHQIRIRDDGNERADAGKSQDVNEWADEAILAYRVLTYATPYVVLHPSMDRFAETAQKLGEDYSGKSARPLGQRSALVHVNEAINLADVLEQQKGNMRKAVASTTLKMEQRVQEGVDQLNSRNSHPGSEMF